jgi:flagellar protein FlgJ
MKIQNGFSLKAMNPEKRAERRDAHLHEAAKMYEQHFLSEMVKAMRSTVHHDNGFLKPNMAEKIFTEQLDQQYVKGWADKGGVGLADLIYNQIQEKYYGGGANGLKRDFSHPTHGLPIRPTGESHGFKPATDSLRLKMIPQPPTASQLEYRFEVQDPSGSPYDVQAPMAGKIASATKLADGWSVVELDHGRGLRSELTFPGTLTPIAGTPEVEAGQKLGALDLKRPILAWKLDWTG